MPKGQNTLARAGAPRKKTPLEYRSSRYLSVRKSRINTLFKDKRYLKDLRNTFVLRVLLRSSLEYKRIEEIQLERRKHALRTFYATRRLDPEARKIGWYEFLGKFLVDTYGPYSKEDYSRKVYVDLDENFQLVELPTGVEDKLEADLLENPDAKDEDIKDDNE